MMRSPCIKVKPSGLNGVDYTVDFSIKPLMLAKIGFLYKAHVKCYTAAV